MTSTTTTIRRMIAALTCGGLLALGAAPAQAGRDHDGWRDRYEQRHERRHDYRHQHWVDRGWHRGHAIGHGHRHHHPGAVVHNHYYGAPYAAWPSYGYPRHYSRDPAVVIGVDIPPLVIPLR